MIKESRDWILKIRDILISSEIGAGMEWETLVPISNPQPWPNMQASFVWKNFSNHDNHG